MARYTFGGRSGDFGINDPATTSGAMVAAISQTGGTVWTAQTGGTQLTDLLVGGSPVTTISTDSHGRLVAFQGPDGYNDGAWITFGGAPRTMIDPQGPFSLQADAVPLSTTTPLAPTAGGFAGTASTAMRGDARVPLPPAAPGPIWLSSGAVVPMSVPTTAMAPTTLNRAHFAPLYVRTPSRAALSCTAVSVLVTTAASAGGQIRFALYPSNTDGSINLAGKLFDSGDIAATSTGVKSAAYVSSVAEGLYWGAVVQHTSATSAFMQGDHRMFFPDSVTNTGQMQTFAIQNSVTGALPTTGSLTPGGDGAPLLFFTIA